MSDPSGASSASLPGDFMSDPGDNLRRLTGLYRTMARIRAFEETALAAHKASAQNSVSRSETQRFQW